MILRLVFDQDQVPGVAALVRELGVAGFRVLSRHATSSAMVVVRGELPDSAVADVEARLERLRRDTAWWDFWADCHVEALRLLLEVVANQRAVSARKAKARGSQHDAADLGPRARLEVDASEWGAEAAETKRAVDLFAERGWIRLEETGAGENVWLHDAGAVAVRDWEAGRSVELALPDGRRWDLTRHVDDDGLAQARVRMAPVRRHRLGLDGLVIRFNGTAVYTFSRRVGPQREMLRTILDSYPRKLMATSFSPEVQRCARELKKRLRRLLRRVCGVPVLRAADGFFVLVDNVEPEGWAERNARSPS